MPDAQPPEPTPEQQERLAGIRAQFQQRREIGEKLDRIKHKIGVYSGKGGVGKTTIAVNLAALLARDGASVGIFDADIDCPNVTRLLRMSEANQIADGDGDGETGSTLLPPSRFGVKVMSMAFFHQDEEEATIWRGPMIHNAITQFLQITDWGELDYLIVDLPPGTADAPLTIMQTLSLDGYVIVTTPQELARLDALRSINMIKRLDANVLGVVENLSGPIFGSGAGEELAEEANLPFLGRIGMSEEYRDTTQPPVLASEAVAAEYSAVVGALRQQLSSAAATA